MAFSINCWFTPGLLEADEVLLSNKEERNLARELSALFKEGFKLGLKEKGDKTRR